MRRWARFMGAALVVCAASGPAAADEGSIKRDCADAHEQAQRQRIDRRLVRARAAAIACAQDMCPAVVRTECIRILRDLDAAVPSMVIEATDGSERLLEATVDLDGVTVAERLDGSPISVDPGEHVVRLAARDGRQVEERAVLLEGELRRRVVLALPPKAVAAPAVAPALVTTPLQSGSKAATTSMAPVPWTSYALGGLGATGLAVFGIFGLSGFRQQAGLEASCAPACPPGRADDMRRDYLIADIGLGIGVLAIAGATWLVLTRGPARDESLAR